MTVTLVWTENVADSMLVFAILGVSGVLYAFVGILIGSVLLGELKGSLALVFLDDVDVILQRVSSQRTIGGQSLPALSPVSTPPDGHRGRLTQ